jgi:hypothetical protein
MTVSGPAQCSLALRPARSAGLQKRPFPKVLQVIRRLLTRPGCFRLEREFAGPDFHRGEQCTLARHTHQRRRKKHPPHRVESEKCALRWPRSGSRELGLYCFPHRNLQIAQRRSASLLHRRAHQAGQPLARLASRRAHALGLCGRALHQQTRGVIRRTAAPILEKIKPSEQWDLKTAYEAEAISEFVRVSGGEGGRFPFTGTIRHPLSDQVPANTRVSGAEMPVRLPQGPLPRHRQEWRAGDRAPRARQSLSRPRPPCVRLRENAGWKALQQQPNAIPTDKTEMAVTRLARRVCYSEVPLFWRGGRQAYTGTELCLAGEPNCASWRHSDGSVQHHGHSGA